uniref:Secreted protein n=1 Tax=Heterorhabditis bacteriophora TaxID=37862 RepID=A0A1I7XIX4_HETBA
MTYICRVFLHFVLVGVVLTGSTSPKAILTKLVIGTSLALITKSSERSDLNYIGCYYQGDRNCINTLVYKILIIHHNQTYYYTHLSSHAMDDSRKH